MASKRLERIVARDRVDAGGERRLGDAAGTDAGGSPGERRMRLGRDLGPRLGQQDAAVLAVLDPLEQTADDAEAVGTKPPYPPECRPSSTTRTVRLPPAMPRSDVVIHMCS